MSNEKSSTQDSETKQLKERLLQAVDQLWDVHLELDDLGETEEKGGPKGPESPPVAPQEK